MTIEAAIAGNANGSHIPTLSANDIIWRVSVELGNDRFVGSWDFSGVDEVIGDKRIRLMALNALRVSWGSERLIETFLVIDAWQSSPHSERAFVQLDPWLNLITTFEKSCRPRLLVLTDHLHRADNFLVAIT